MTDNEIRIQVAGMIQRAFDGQPMTPDRSAQMMKLMEACLSQEYVDGVRAESERLEKEIRPIAEAFARSAAKLRDKLLFDILMKK